jgi:hypothetical protein
MEIVNIQVNAEYLCTFKSFIQWVNKSTSWIGGFSKYEKIVCLDKNGNTLTGGEDFQFADKNDLFPVKAYRLLRSSEEIVSKEQVVVHTINLNGSRYLLVTGLPENSTFSVIDKESMPVGLFVHQEIKDAVMPNVFPVNLHTHGHSVELIGLIQDITEEQAALVYPLKIVSWKEPTLTHNSFADMSKEYDTYKEAFIAHVLHSYKRTIDPKTTVLLKFK